ncbi:hypothetical protein H9S92_11770 [Lewinella lacunae]|uniref:Outer membrane protein beta-barrel domain-containing protein n=2 Tax=Neolewinella lacunae TaxID=1517758 RepID=A0A923PIS5_9BACT|nr:hypothetical protein [Neolewinella lacunae]MBC6994845.1 hypothetical protein [Neolewinella lacunae]
MVDLSLVYRIGKGQYGVTAMVRSQLNPVDEEALFSDVLQEPGISFDTEGGRWGMRTALLGAFGSVAFSDKISFHARVMAGIVGVSSPNVEATVTGPAGTFIVEQSSENASAFGRLYGGGFTFNLGNKIALITNLDYFTATPEFSNVEVSINDIPFSTNQSLSQKVVTVNFSVGLGLKF